MRTATNIERSSRVAAQGDSGFDSNDRRSTSLIRFTLVIPALNEEESLASTLEKSLAARCDVIEKTPVKEMKIVVVNDGSTDATQAIADKFHEVVSIRFEKNRGYGAAIKAGFCATEADLLGFMDADGTCDPRFCVQLINNLIKADSDVAVGSRMHFESEMPLIRRIGNFIFARLVGVVSGKDLTDCTSGMRVLRRGSLRQLHPLPDGLHFTPAMTCLALLHPLLKISEVPMPYGKRVGHSKLRVVGDGFRFLLTILFTAALFNPIKSLVSLGALFMISGLAISAIGASLGVGATATLAWSAAFVAVMLQAIFVGFLSHQTLYLLLGPWRLKGFGDSLLQRHVCSSRMIRAGITLLTLGFGAYLLHTLLPQSWRTSVAIGGALLVLLAGWTALAGVILRVIWTANERRNAEHEDPFVTRAK